MLYVLLCCRGTAAAQACTGNRHRCRKPAPVNIARCWPKARQPVMELLDMSRSTDSVLCCTDWALGPCALHSICYGLLSQSLGRLKARHWCERWFVNYAPNEAIIRLELVKHRQGQLEVCAFFSHPPGGGTPSKRPLRFLSCGLVLKLAESFSWFTYRLLLHQRHCCISCHCYSVPVSLQPCVGQVRDGNSSSSCIECIHEPECQSQPGAA